MQNVPLTTQKRVDHVEPSVWRKHADRIFPGVRASNEFIFARFQSCHDPDSILYGNSLPHTQLCVRCSMCCLIGHRSYAASVNVDNTRLRFRGEAVNVRRARRFVHPRPGIGGRGAHVLLFNSAVNAPALIRMVSEAMLPKFASAISTGPDPAIDCARCGPIRTAISQVLRRRSNLRRIPRTYLSSKGATSFSPGGWRGPKQLICRAYERSGDMNRLLTHLTMSLVSTLGLPCRHHHL